MLAETSLAFQGEHNKGHILKLIQLLTEFDPIMEKHGKFWINKKWTLHI